MKGYLIKHYHYFPMQSIVLYHLQLKCIVFKCEYTTLQEVKMTYVNVVLGCKRINKSLNDNLINMFKRVCEFLVFKHEIMIYLLSPCLF